MISTTCDHQPRDDPRYRDTCRKCGLPMPETEASPSATARDADYEEQFLDQAERNAQARHNVPTDGFRVCVERRLRIGEELYSESEPFQLKPLHEQALAMAEEAWDAAAYAVLCAQILLVTNTGDDAVIWHLLEIAVHAAAIHSHTRYLMRPED